MYVSLMYHGLYLGFNQVPQVNFHFRNQLNMLNDQLGIFLKHMNSLN